MSDTEWLIAIIVVAYSLLMFERSANCHASLELDKTVQTLTQGSL